MATGSDIAADAIEGAQRWALPLRPIEDFVAKWSVLAPRLAEADRPRIAVIGAGAGGVEVALAVAYAMRAAGNGSQVQLVSGGALLPGHSERARARVQAALVQSQVRLIDSIAGSSRERPRRPARRRISFSTDLTLLASGAAHRRWLQPSGLALDAAGFILVDRQLRSVSHDSVFAAGDIATIVDAPRARSGVYAVRAGPPLADNLLRAALGQTLRRHTPQKTALYLLATGPQHAIGSWNGVAWSGDWVWRWKNRIDRGFHRGISLLVRSPCARSPFLGFVFFVLPLLVLAAGQFGWLMRRSPYDLGVTDGKLKPPSRTPNSVSSQAGLWPDGDYASTYASIEPLRVRGDSATAITRLRALLAAWPGARIVAEEPDYLRVEFMTRWLRFVDDAEFWLDPATQVIQVRSASRVGRKDFGVNRRRIEALRARWDTAGA